MQLAATTRRKIEPLYAARATGKLLTVATKLANNYLSMYVSGVTNHGYRVQYTSNYTDWVTVSTNNIASFWYSNLVNTNIPLNVFRIVY